MKAKLGIPSLEGLLRQGRLRWFGHVKRMDDENWEKKMLTHVAERKYIGRPKKRWLDNDNDVNITHWNTAKYHKLVKM